MLQEFWSYFATTGSVDAYLNFKEYESEYNGLCVQAGEGTHE